MFGNTITARGDFTLRSPAPADLSKAIGPMVMDGFQLSDYLSSQKT